MGPYKSGVFPRRHFPRRRFPRGRNLFPRGRFPRRRFPRGRNTAGPVRASEAKQAHGCPVVDLSECSEAERAL